MHLAHHLGSSAASGDRLMGGSNASLATVIDVAKAHRPFTRLLLRAAVVCSILALIAIALLRNPYSIESSSSSPPSSSTTTTASTSSNRLSSTRHVAIEGKETMSEHESRALQHYASSRLSQRLLPKDFLEFSYRLRFYGELFDAYEMRRTEDTEEYAEMLRRWHKHQEVLKSHNASTLPSLSEMPVLYPDSPTLWGLECELFPWAHSKFPSLLELKRSFRGRGIVIPTGSHHLRFAIHLVRHIRYLNCHLPISVAYAGEKDLKPEELDFLRRMNVDLLDVAQIFDVAMLSLGGWEIKPFALLAAPYEEVILADADVVFLQNPTILLEDPGYQQHGAIIFHDRTLFAGDTDKTRWLVSNLPQPLSKRIRQSRMYQRKSAHEQESGVVVWNKNERFLGLLAACKMNAKTERELVTYKTFYGDKESFWIGLEMAQQSWSELQPVPGVIGDSRFDEKKDQLVACGRILQFDREGWPLWFNGAIVEDKRSETKSSVVMNFTHFAREGIWDFGTSCLDHEVTAINATLKSIIHGIASLWVPKIDYRGSAEPVALQS